MADQLKQDQLKQRMRQHFERLVQNGCDANEAAARALALVRADAAVELAASSCQAPSAPSQPAPVWAAPNAEVGASKYGPLCLGLAGPFQSICITGMPRFGKKLLVLDIDHTIYDPSDYGGSKGSVVKADRSGFYDESIIARCRPGLHEFLTEVYRWYDLMVWSASDMIRILTLLQQLGMVGAGHSDYQVLAVLDMDSMSELSHSGAAGMDGTPVSATPGAMVQPVTVPPGAIAGQQIEVRSIKDGTPMVVTVPAGLQPGDEFHVTIPGAVSSVSEELGIDAEDVQLALQLSMGSGRPDVGASVAGGATDATGARGGEGSDAGAAAAGVAPMAKARKKGRRVKPLSLLWACHEFSHLYSEKNTVIVDDTVDVCSANPHNSIQCTRYFLQDHQTDAELSRLARYLARIAQAPEMPDTHMCWRNGL